jgi:hypothetical protein
LEIRRIDNPSSINTENLNKDHYFISILQEGFNAGIIDMFSMQNIQIGIASILKELIIKYTGGDSSSVKESTAFNILCSVHYVLDIYAAALYKPSDIFTVLREKNVGNIYKDGIQIVQSYVDESKRLYNVISMNKQSIPLGTYHDTIDIALPDFFTNYDIDFAAHDTMSSMDYPLVFDDMTVGGILYIHQYLEKLKLEMQFCDCFSLQNILKLLSGFSRKYCFDIANAPINLFEILFDQSVFSVLSGEDAGALTVSGLQFTLLNEELTVGYAKLHSIVDQAITKITEKFDIHNTKLIEYMNKYKELFLGRLSTALENTNLSNIIIIEGKNPDDDKITFQDGDRMCDTLFAHLVDLILEREDVREKVTLISSNIHSMNDYIDLLDSDCLYGNEFMAAFEALSDIDLAILGGRIFCEELRCGILHLLPQKLIGYRESAETEWQMYYIDYLSSLSENRKKEIEKLINHISINTEDIYFV